MIIDFARKSLVLAGLLLLAACGGKIVVGTNPNVNLVQGTALPAPEGVTSPTALAERQLIAPFDKLRIDVYGMAGMQDRIVMVDGAGKISFPLAGEIDALGITQGQLATRVRDRLRAKYVRDPQVSVNFAETMGGTLTVEGAVNQPGIYPVRERMTLIKAIATARGTNQNAKYDAVLVFRKVNGVNYVAAYDLSAIRRGNYSDPEVFANDVVVVNDSQARQLFRDLAPLLSAPLIAVLNQI